jgi:branched-chain amino acid transport system ATP-binding protein
VKNVSYGEQRKLEIILSLASDPKLLLLDEPTAGLAIDEITTFTNTVKTLARGTAILFTAHNMDVVFDLADRVIVLYFGKLIAQGSPKEIQADTQVQEIYLGTRESMANAEVN